MVFTLGHGNMAMETFTNSSFSIQSWAVYRDPSLQKQRLIAKFFHMNYL